MYGDVAGTARPDVPPQIEPVSSVNQNTLAMLSDSNVALSNLLAKIRGSQPESTNKLEKVPERHMLADARLLRELAGQIFEKTQELHRYIGHEKQ